MDVEIVEGNDMAQEIPSASIVESLYFNEFQILPDLAEGVFSRRPQRVAMTTRLDTDGKVIRFCHQLQNALEHPKLHLPPPLPHMLNYFDLRWRRMLLSL